jgi:hypothetical protein
LPFTRALPSTANAIAVADVDGDDFADVVTTHFNVRTFNVLLSRPAP